MFLGLVLALTSAPRAQAPVPLTPADRAAQALKQGKFVEVDSLLQGATDPRSLAIRARALTARGRYGDAEMLLTRAAAAAPTSDAALELGILQIKLGRRDEGIKILNTLADTLMPRTVAEYVRFGHAVRAIGGATQSAQERHVTFEDAGTAFREASGRAPKDADILAALGELFAEANDPAKAVEYFQSAIKIDESNAAALTGFAALSREQNPPDARTALDLALKSNPNYEPAHLLVAGMALDDRRRADAQAAIKKALEVNPNSFEARALDAALAFLEGRTADFDRITRELLALQPTYGEVYRIVGENAASNYRFEEAAEFAKRAIALDPKNTRAYADLGMHLLRTGDEVGARRALERSWESDSHDYVTYNLLDLLDRLDKFEVTQEGDITAKFSKEEAPIMREQVLPLAREALETLSKRWDYQIQGPILIEMFPKHDDFAVRNLGLPGMIGALGACFGKVVTIDSPQARQPPGEYNWQPTLWHELAHVLTLQLSNNRVPRWVTEGMSVWEERRARPEWGHEMEVPFAQALERGKTLTIATLNEGFSDPELIALSYHHASLVVEHLAATYGTTSLKTLLRAYGRGLETEAAFKEAFGATIDEVQKSFDAKLEREYGPLRQSLKGPTLKEKPDLEGLKKLASENPGSFPVLMSLGGALASSGDRAGAIATYERAAKLVPNATGNANPNKQIALIALEQKDNARAITALEAVLKVDHADVDAARTLAPMVAALGDSARTQDAYQRLVNVDPFEVSAQAALGKVALQRRDLPIAIRSFRTVLATKPPDRAAAYTDLAEAYLLAGRAADAKTQVLAALEIAPGYERAQDLLLRTLGPAK